jgi:betaine lipid synthase
MTLRGSSFVQSWLQPNQARLQQGRDDFENHFGTIIHIKAWEFMWRKPHTLWMGCLKNQRFVDVDDGIGTLASAPKAVAPTMSSTVSLSHTGATQTINAATTELAANTFPPPSFYQNPSCRRMDYDERAPKHTQFGGRYIYAFTWEDSRVDHEILRLGPNDMVLAITSAGDNILSYASLEKPPARIHAVDLNPSQNHLLELKVASYMALPYEDFWKLFGEGQHADFRSLLVKDLSPLLSSQAIQYWLKNTQTFTGKGGLYDTGGSKYGIRIFRYFMRALGGSSAVTALLNAKDLDEQHRVWRSRIRPLFLSGLFAKLIASRKLVLWMALGVPKNQLAMVEAEHANSTGGPEENTRSHAVSNYMINTFDPVAEQTHIATDNHYYRVSLAGRYAPWCAPDYLTRETHARLALPGAFEGLRIHTDEIEEVITRLEPGSLTVAVIMDSMDWFEKGKDAATRQIRKLNRVLAMKGRVLLRSGARYPWYITNFTTLGFVAQRHGDRKPGMCIDRVNMYASCWICTKVADVA